jgi:hypothetical protein
MAEDNPSDAAENRWTVRGGGSRGRAGGGAVGAWLCQAIDRAIQAERKPIDVISSTAEPRKPRTKPDAEKLLTMTKQAIAAAAQLAEAEKVPPDLRDQLEMLLRKSLPAPVQPAASDL